MKKIRNLLTFSWVPYAGGDIIPIKEREHKNLREYILIIFIILMLNKSIGKVVTYSGIGNIDKIFGFFFGCFVGCFV